MYHVTATFLALHMVSHITPHVLLSLLMISSSVVPLSHMQWSNVWCLLFEYCIHVTNRYSRASMLKWLSASLQTWQILSWCTVKYLFCGTPSLYFWKGGIPLFQLTCRCTVSPNSSSYRSSKGPCSEIWLIIYIVRLWAALVEYFTAVQTTEKLWLQSYKDKNAMHTD